MILKELNVSDVTKDYLMWMNDEEVHKYTEQRYKKHLISDVKKFVRDKKKSKYEFLYGIFLREKKLKKHIGNIKLGPINWTHKTAIISYFIGRKEMWGKGYGSLAIKKICITAKKKGIKKIKAEIYEMNKVSQKVLEKNGFKIEGKLSSGIIFNNKRYQEHIYGKIL